MLTLNKIKPAKGATKKRKIVGRGNSSGHGTYSCRGMKGQKARSGVSNLKRLGMKKQLLQTPKVRGFKSEQPKNQVVNLGDINKKFQDGAKVNPETLLAAGLIAKKDAPVKVLGDGALALKGLEFSGVKMSKTVADKIKK